jgi:hypothetical protein
MASDLFLLAVRYIAGELPDDELAAFESRLEHDQAAREAVAQAVELAGAVARLPAATPDLLPTIPPRKRWQRVGALAAAACLAVAAGVVLRPRHEPHPSPAIPSAGAPAPAESVVLAWSGLRQSGEIDLVSHSELLAWLDEPAGPPLADVLVPEPGGTEEEGLPLWLLEATSLREPSPREGGAREN